ncbi:MAG: PstS family phosphate ABC transporter substrate-binding protein [Chloroflexi bacterium]|nr:PstS family phosphate ABC transporter substrate-binding protein [Chloroflexota bacterium]
MSTTQRRVFRYLLPLFALVLISAIACGSDDATAAAPTAAPAKTSAPAVTTAPAPTKAPTEKLSGTVEIDGSSTVFPISQAVAEEFRKVQSGVQIPVGISGTGGGFKRFAVGETDISDASRPIKDSEREKAAANGIEFVEIRVAFDGLSIMVSKDNDFAQCLTTAELSRIWAPGSSVDNWNEVRSSFPDQKLRLYGPDTDSGTFDYFTDEINGEEGASRPDYTASADDNVLVQGIAGDRNSLGYFGYAYYVENKDKLNLVAVDSGTGCIAPEPKTINDGSYSPLSRPLFIYVNTKSLERPEVKAFVNYYLENAAELSAEVGYVGLSQAEYDEGSAAVNGG